MVTFGGRPQGERHGGEKRFQIVANTRFPLGVGEFKPQDPLTYGRGDYLTYSATFPKCHNIVGQNRYLIVNGVAWSKVESDLPKFRQFQLSPPQYCEVRKRAFSKKKALRPDVNQTTSRRRCRLPTGHMAPAACHRWDARNGKNYTHMVQSSSVSVNSSPSLTPTCDVWPSRRAQ